MYKYNRPQNDPEDEEDGPTIRTRRPGALSPPPRRSYPNPDGLAILYLRFVMLHTMGSLSANRGARPRPSTVM